MRNYVHCLYTKHSTASHSALKGAKTSTVTAVPSTAQSIPAPNEVEEQEKIQESGGKEQDIIEFESRCILFQLEGASTEKTWNLLDANIVLKIVFDAEMLCYRIIAQDGNQQYLRNSIITIETELIVNGLYFCHTFYQFY